MLAEFLINGSFHRFRISFLSRKDSLTIFDIELTDISEAPTDKYNGVIIDYFKWREALKKNKIKLII